MYTFFRIMRTRTTGICKRISISQTNLNFLTYRRYTDSKDGMISQFMIWWWRRASFPFAYPFNFLIAIFTSFFNIIWIFRNANVLIFAANFFDALVWLSFCGVWKVRFLYFFSCIYVLLWLLIIGLAKWW